MGDGRTSAGELGDVINVDRHALRPTLRGPNSECILGGPRRADAVKPVLPIIARGIDDEEVLVLIGVLIDLHVIEQVALDVDAPAVAMNPRPRRIGAREQHAMKVRRRG